MPLLLLIHSEGKADLSICIVMIPDDSYFFSVKSYQKIQKCNLHIGFISISSSKLTELPMTKNLLFIILLGQNNESRSGSTPAGSVDLLNITQKIF